MKKNILSKLFCLVLALSMVLCLGITANAEETASGTCGANVNWSYADGTLTLTGTGATDKYTASPFAALKADVTSVVIGEGITRIEEYLFYQMENIQSVQLPSTLEAITLRAFSYCTGLKEITIPESVSVIGAYAFLNSGITDVYFESDTPPKTVSATSPFGGCSYVVHVPCNSTAWTEATISKWGGSSKTLSFDHKVENNACIYCGAVGGQCGENVYWVLENGTLNIFGTGATNKYTASPFAAYKADVTSVVVGEGITRLEEYLFYQMENIQSVQLPSTLEAITLRAFSYCTGLKEITVPESVSVIGAYAFLNSGITDVYFESATPPKTVSTTSPFGGLTYKVHVPCNGSWTADTISKWGGSSKTLVLEHTYVDGICTDCGASTNYCGQNITWTLADGVLTLNGTGATYDYSSKDASPFYSIKDQVTSIVISEGITKLGIYMFYEMSQLTEVQLPSTLTHINSRNFGYCTALEQITIPASVTFLGGNAFINSGIQDAIFEGATAPSISADGGVFGGCSYNVHVPCNGTWTGDVLDGLGGAPALAPSHSFEGDTCTICGAKKVFAIVENGEEVAVYGTLIEAVSARVSGQLIRLLEDAQVEITLSEDLFIDLAGKNLSGTITCGNYKVYGIDSTTDGYTSENRGIFSCADENGAAIVPVSNFQTKLAKNNRYMAIAEENGYSFHRFYVGITHISLKPDTVGVGYKAKFAGDDMVKAQLTSYGYSLSLDGGNTVKRTKAAAEFVSEAPVTLRVNNYDAANFGKTELYAVAIMTLTDGTVIESAKQTITLYDLMHQINDNAGDYSETKLSAIYDMIEANEAMQTWGLAALWSDAEAAAALKTQVDALDSADNDTLTALFEEYDAQGYVHLTRGGAPYVISPEGTTVMLSDVDPDYVNRMTEADYNQLIALGESYISNMSGLVYGNMKTAFNAETTNEMDCSSFLQLVLGGVSYENSKYAADANTSLEGFGVEFPDNPYRTEFGAERYLANDLAQYAYDMGVAFTPNADATNMQPGDILFFSTKTTNGYFMDITHAAICVERQEGNVVYVLHCSSDGDLVRYYEIDLFSDTIYGGLMSNPYKDSLVLIARFPV